MTPPADDLTETAARIAEAADAEGRAVSRALARQILEADPQTLSLFDEAEQ